VRIFCRLLCNWQFGSLNPEFQLVWVSLFYNANVAFALASLKGVNIPIYIALKRLTPLAVVGWILCLEKKDL